MSVQKYNISLLILIVLFITGCASGSAIVTGTKRPPIDPNQVKLYLQPPANYEIIGIVSASSDAGWTEQGSQDYAVQELKNQAAELVANGILLTTTGEKTSTAIGSYGTGYFYTIPITAKTVSGQAIYANEQ